LDLVNAIRVSDDVFFYNLGALMNSNAPGGGALQRWAHLYGIGRKTGVDLPGELGGTLPDAAWRAQRNALEAECDAASGPFRSSPGTRRAGVGSPTAPIGRGRRGITSTWPWGRGMCR
jgi:cell division protein FtsI/penicillin-binding protein 2